MPKILWLSTISLHDSSSGASVNASYMLKALQKRGFEVWALNSFVFKAPSGGQRAFGDIKSLFTHDPNKVFVFDENHIHYIYTRCINTEESEMTLKESHLFFNTWVQVLNEYEPDLVIGFGDSPLVSLCFAEAKRRLISTHYMVSSRDNLCSLFSNIDLLTADSNAIAKRYHDIAELNVIPIGDFFELKDIIAPVRKKHYVTFINPSAHKGLSIFAKLAKTAQIKMPEVEFLVVNSNQTFHNDIKKLHTKDKSSEHPYDLTDFPNVFLVNAQDDIRKIYSITSVLLVPSLWFEPWGRVATEATLNGIPVVATNIGGLNEATGGGGFLVDAPRHTLEDFYSLPDDEEIEPWLEALEKALNTDWWSTMEAAKKQLSVDVTVDNLVSIINPLIMKGQYLRAFAKLNREAADAAATSVDEVDTAAAASTDATTNTITAPNPNHSDSSLVLSNDDDLATAQMLNELQLDVPQENNNSRFVYSSPHLMLSSLSEAEIVKSVHDANTRILSTHQKVLAQFSSMNSKENTAESIPKKARTKANMLSAFKENQREKAQSAINQLILRHETRSEIINNLDDSELSDISF